MKNLVLCFFAPVIYHSLCNGLMSVNDPNQLFIVIGNIAAISYIVVAVLAVIMILHWQKNRTLDIPVQN